MQQSIAAANFGGARGFQLKRAIQIQPTVLGTLRTAPHTRRNSLVDLRLFWDGVKYVRLQTSFCSSQSCTTQSAPKSLHN
jgi:hypothetical protein